jgi:ABC-type branched-subunit amino acid transport system substrate-binding protein
MIRDSAGDTWLGMQEAMSIIGDGRAVAVVGPVRTAIARVVSPIASRCRVPFVMSSSTSLPLSLHKVHEFILRLSPSSRVLSQAVIDVIQEFEWNYVAIIKSDGEQGEATLYFMEQLAQQQEVQIIGTVDVPVYAGSENRTAIIETIKSRMQSLVTLHARIFVLSVLNHRLEMVLQAANDVGLVGNDYVWIIDSIESPEESMTPSLSKLLQGSLGLSASLPRSAMEWEQKHNLSFTTVGQLYSYDAVWLIAYALHQFLQDGHSLDRRALHRAEGSPQLYRQIDGHLLLKYMKNVSFEGISGEVDFVDETGERLKTYNVVNMYNASFCTIGKWSFTGSSRKKRIDVGPQYQSPKWYSGSGVIPSDRETSTTQHITALAIISEPYLYQSNNSEKAISGYLIDVIDKLKSDIGFTYSLKLWTSSYDAAIEKISQANHPYTLLVADVARTAYRSRFVDFSHSYLTVYMGILVKRPQFGTASGIWGFLAPFSYKVWLLILGFSLFGAVVLQITERCRRGHPNLTFEDSLWISFSCMFGEALPQLAHQLQ